MRFLLDTAVLLWAAVGNLERLSKKVLTVLQDPGNPLVLSAATTWEIAIKFLSGKIILHQGPHAFIDDSVAKLSLIHLPITHLHALETGRLPLHHKDPFDRLLIAQAKIEGLPIITPDDHFAPYGVRIIW